MVGLKTMYIMFGIMLDRGILALRLYGDSKVVIGSLNGDFQNQDIVLSHLITQVIERVSRLTFFKSSHRAGI
jgi:hypothetical protein